MDPRSDLRVKSHTWWPSRETVPDWGSWNLINSLINVVFPEPVGPTKPTVRPAGTSRLRPLRTSSLSGYENSTSLNSNSPLTSLSIKSPSTIPTSVSSRSNTRVVDAMALWYRSNVSPSLVSGHRRLWVMNTITEYAPKLILPSSAIHPPTSILAENANKIAILIIGTKDADSLIASLFASL